MTHYYDSHQDSAFEPVQIRAHLRGREILLYTSKGVFSRKKVDTGTQLLIDKGVMRDGWRILDLGCGYGPLGIGFALAYPSADIVMTDVNERAVKLARMNRDAHPIKNVTIHSGEGFEKVTGKFDAIFFNPPQCAGRKACLSLIGQAKEYLKDNGYLQVVMRHNKGGKYTAEEMESIFGNVDAVAKQSGYRIYVSVKGSEVPPAPSTQP